LTLLRQFIFLVYIFLFFNDTKSEKYLDIFSDFTPCGLVEFRPMFLLIAFWFLLDFFLDPENGSTTFVLNADELTRR
jgi:hypothetical protein